MSSAAPDEGRPKVDPSGWPRVASGSADFGEERLRRWGRVLGAAAAEAGVFVALYGPLGGGKTTLVEAAARGAGIVDPVRSPTYVLHRRLELPNGRFLHHVDLYRLEGPGDMEDLGWDELLASGDSIFVEWSDRAGDRLPADRWDVRLGFEEEPARRHVEVARRGESPPLPAPGGPEREEPNPAPASKREGAEPC